MWRGISKEENVHVFLIAQNNLIASFKDGLKKSVINSLRAGTIEIYGKTVEEMIGEQLNELNSYDVEPSLSLRMEKSAPDLAASCVFSVQQIPIAHGYQRKTYTPASVILKLNDDYRVYKWPFFPPC